MRELIFTQSRQGYRYNIDTFLLFDFASSLNFKGCVLDVGCGCGIVGILLKEHFPKISLFLLDIMSENCDLARRNLAQNGIKASVICADFAGFARLKNGKNLASKNINFIGKKSENLKNLNANFTNKKSENLNFLSKNSKNLNSLCGENSINLNSISDNFTGEKIMNFRDENTNFINQKDEKFTNKNANFLNEKTQNSTPEKNDKNAKNDKSYKNAKFSNLNAQKFDFIVSNPPFYRQGALQSPNEFVKRGKSSHSLSLENFVNASSALLTPNGTLCFCYEVGALQELCAHLSAAKLKITRLKFVHKNATQRARLALIVAKKGAKSPCELQNPLFVYENGELSAKMQEIYTKIRVRSADL